MTQPKYFKLYDSELNEIADVPNRAPMQLLLVSYFNMQHLGTTKDHIKYKVEVRR